MSSLEKTKRTFPENGRILYVPVGVSWDVMWEHAVKSVKAGSSVWLHEHSYTSPCGVTTRCGHIELTPDGSGAILVPDSKTETETDPDN